MKVKPKEVLLNLPIVLMFSDACKVPEFAANINQLVSGKVKVKYEELGSLGDQFVGLFYLQRNDEFTELRQQFMTLIEQEEVVQYELKQHEKIPRIIAHDEAKQTIECQHNWVMDGHNAGEPICSKCLKRE